MDIETGLHSTATVFTQSPYQSKTAVWVISNAVRSRPRSWKNWRNKCLLYFRWLMLFSEVFVTCTDIHMLNL